MKIKHKKDIKYNLFGDDIASDLTEDKIYDVVSIEQGWYRIIDDSGEDYLYPPDIFEIVEE